MNDTAKETGASRWLKPAIAVATSVLAAILIAALSPVGDWLHEALFPTSASVNGIVRTAGSPVEGAVIIVDGERKGSTASDGSFTVKDVDDGDHDLNVEALGAVPLQTAFRLSRGEDSLDLGTIELVASVRLVADIKIQPRLGQFTVTYDVATWIEESGPDSGLTQVLYSLGGPLAVQLGPVDKSVAKFCSGVVADLPLPEVPRGLVEATLVYANGGKLKLTSEILQDIPQGARPEGCRTTTVETPAPVSATTDPPAPRPPSVVVIDEPTTPVSPPATGSETTPTPAPTSAPLEIDCAPSGPNDSEVIYRTVTADSQVMWKNPTAEQMTLQMDAASGFTSGSSPSPGEETHDIEPQSNVVLTFNETGVYPFNCSFSDAAATRYGKITVE